jgi:hypothetical protein
VVEESESVLDKGASSHEGNQNMIREVLGRNDTPEDIFIEQGPWVHWDQC